MNDSPSLRRPLSPGRVVGFTALAFLLFLLLLEVGLQIAALVVGPQGHYPPGVELPAPDPSAYRVLAVGDSWVFGAESEPDEAFIEVFARARAARTGRTVQVFNLGVPGSNSAQALVSMDDVIDVVQPDLVVALTGANDQIHDLAVDEAERRMGSDARMLPGWSALSRLRTVKLARILWVNLHPPPAPLIDASLQSAEQGGAGLPHPPAVRAATVYLLPWWELFRQRRWDDALTLLRSLPTPQEPRQRGLKAAWEGLLLAHLDRVDDAEARVQEALDLGGDRATAWVARAVIDEGHDRPLRALQDRLRAVDTAPDDGFPFLRERALGLALLDLEAWEAAEVWLMGCELAVPGNFEVLMGLARLSGAARSDAAEQALFRGPRGLVTPQEFYRWHLASSGRLDRAAGSLGEEDPGEAAELQVYRGRAALAGGDRPGARRWFLGVLGRDDARPLDRDRAVAGLVAAREPGTPLLDVVPEADLARLRSVSAAPAVVAAEREDAACSAALASGQAGLAAGMSPVDLEQALGRCASAPLIWSLVEQGLAARAVVDRGALVLGLRPGGRPGPIPAPKVQRWDLFRLRDFDGFARRNEPAWQALAAAHQGRWEAWAELLAQGEAAGREPAVLALGRAMAYDEEGRWRDAWDARVEAASAAGPPWIRALARGTLAAQAHRWDDAQADLLNVLRVAPGYLEALEALSQVPPERRGPATDLALRDAPSGRIRSERWARWYLNQGRVEEAAVALRFGELLAPSDPLAAALIRGEVARERGAARQAAEAFGLAADLANARELPRIGCRALAWRQEVLPAPTAAAVLHSACADSPDARLIALDGAAGRCDQARPLALSALEQADPLDVLERAGGCLSVADASSALGEGEGPPWAAAWLVARLGPEAAATAARLTDRSHDRLIRHLDSMARRARARGSRFVALTYPFPAAHHEGVRRRILAGGRASGFEVLDLYAEFDRALDRPTWEAMKTPEDHVNAVGYARMGRALDRWLAGDR